MMTPHHEGAVTMAHAEIKDGGDPEPRALAKAMISEQQREIAEMRDHLGGAQDGAGHGG